MKKFKLFALALFAMLSTNVFATAGEEDANNTFRFIIVKDYVASPEAYGLAQIIGFVGGHTDFATTKIPAYVTGDRYSGKYKVVGIGANAFDGKAITTLDLTEAEYIGALTVDGVALTAAEQAYSIIGKDAFKGTSITTLDLSATKITTVNQWFETTNTKVTTIKLPSTVDVIAANAFKGLSALNSLTIAEPTAPAKHALQINANAFENTMALKTLTLPADVSFVAASAFAKTSLEELTIKGDVPAVTTTAGVQGLAFVRNGSQKLTVNYEPTGAGNVASFAQNAFAADVATTGAEVWVTFKTTTAYGNAFAASALTADAKGNYLYGAKLDFTPTAKAKIKVYNQGGSYSYGTMIVPNGGITIAKKQGDANVMVYGAYVDNAETPAILMEQLHLINGSYYIPSTTGSLTNIIVKTSGTADVEYTTGVALNGVNQDSRNHKIGSTTASEKLQNEIKAYSGVDVYASDVTPSAAGLYVIFLKPLAETTFGWAEFSDTRIVKDGQFYLEAKTPAAARRVIWLDGSEEEATAIKSVKKANAEKGAIYNLAGQKVNAAYKGVVIKEGKKYIQK